MLVIKSMLPKGTSVQTVLGGKPRLTTIKGRGTAESEVLTDDMTGQKNFGFITISGAPLRGVTLSEAEAAAAEALVLEEAEKAAEAAEEAAVKAKEEADAEVVNYSKDELKAMKKEELVALVEKFKLDIDVEMKPAKIVKALLKYELPKE